MSDPAFSNFAPLDFSRHSLKGVTEIMLADRKTAEQSIAIAKAFQEKTGRAILSRVPQDLDALIDSSFAPPRVVERTPACRAIVIRTHGISGTRLVCDRRVREVTTPWGPVRVKEKLLNGKVLSASPEFEDCARLVREKGMPLRAVMDRARRADE